MSNPSPPTFNYSNLSFAVTLVGNQFIFTFTIPTKPGLQLSNPIYVNAVEMTIQKDRFNPNLVALGDDKGVYTLNYLNQIPPAASLNLFIASLLLLVPVPSGPVSLTSFGAGTSLVQDGVGPNLAIYSLVGAGTTSVGLVGTEVQISSASTDVTLATAAGATGSSLVVDGSGPSLTTVGILAGTDISVTPSGDDLIIAYTGTPAATPSPAFIATHVPDFSFAYNSPYTAVHWDNISQSSTDVTYNSGTDEFTTVVTGDYLVTFYFPSSDTAANFLAMVMNTGTNVPIVSALALAPAWGAQNNYCTPQAVAVTYDYNETGACASLAQVIHLTAADTFSIGITPDPTPVFGWGDGFMESINGLDLQLCSCSIKRLL